MYKYKKLTEDTLSSFFESNPIISIESITTTADSMQIGNQTTQYAIFHIVYRELDFQIPSIQNHSVSVFSGVPTINK